jgi:Protein of unknown function (DUF 659)
VVQSLPAGYTPPAYDSARTVLLDKTVADVERDLEPWSDRTRKTGASVTSDGWSDTTNRPLLNMLAVNAKGAKFVDAINTEGQQKTAEYIAEQLEAGIELVGPEFVVQVLTDNAANCKAAGAIIMAKYPGMFWSPCVAHVCDLALEDIFKADKLTSVHIETKEMIKFIKCVRMPRCCVHRSMLGCRASTKSTILHAISCGCWSCCLYRLPEVRPVGDSCQVPPRHPGSLAPDGGGAHGAGDC